MQLKNVGVIVVTLVPLDITHLQSEGRKKEHLSSFLPPLLNEHMHVHTHTCTHPNTHLCGSFLLVPSTRLTQPFISCCQCRWRRCWVFFSFYFIPFWKSWYLFFFFFLEWQLTDSSDEGQCARIVLVHDNHKELKQLSTQKGVQQDTHFSCVLNSRCVRRCINRLVPVKKVHISKQQ